MHFGTECEVRSAWPNGSVLVHLFIQLWQKGYEQCDKDIDWFYKQGLIKLEANLIVTFKQCILNTSFNLWLVSTSLTAVIPSLQTSSEYVLNCIAIQPNFLSDIGLYDGHASLAPNRGESSIQESHSSSIQESHSGAGLVCSASHRHTFLYSSVKSTESPIIAFNCSWRNAGAMPPQINCSFNSV